VALILNDCGRVFTQIRAPVLGVIFVETAENQRDASPVANVIALVIHPPDGHVFGELVAVGIGLLDSVYLRRVQFPQAWLLALTMKLSFPAVALVFSVLVVAYRAILPFPAIHHT
jgi:hypothetical protein